MRGAKRHGNQRPTRTNHPQAAAPLNPATTNPNPPLPDRSGGTTTNVIAILSTPALACHAELARAPECECTPGAKRETGAHWWARLRGNASLSLRESLARPERSRMGGNQRPSPSSRPRRHPEPACPELAERVEGSKQRRRHNPLFPTPAEGQPPPTPARQHNNTHNRCHN